jgi:hypothetical protein
MRLRRAMWPSMPTAADSWRPDAQPHEVHTVASHSEWRQCTKPLRTDTETAQPVTRTISWAGYDFPIGSVGSELRGGM